MFAAIRRFKGLFAVAALGIAVSFVAVDMAEARRASGGFGSRGTRTFSAPPATNTAPGQAAPMNRSMTPNTNRRRSQMQRSRHVQARRHRSRTAACSVA